MKNRILYYFFLVIFLAGCSVTKPKLNYSGGTYNSVSDDIIIYNSTQEAIEKLVANLNKEERILLIQIVDSKTSDLMADRIYEEFYKSGYIVGVAMNNDLESIETSKFDKFMMFYPTIYGTETAKTEPTFWPKFFASMPVIGWLFGSNILAAYSYVDRQAGVSIHCRLVDAKTGEIEWIRNFTGQDKIRLEGGKGHDIIFPKK
jgi:PBP1b-binding outer membrane lipoprotein LpoB